jgi:Transposase DDE domain group 1
LLTPKPAGASGAATLAMNDNTILPFSFPAVARKKITAAFDGGRLTSDGGVMLLAMADRRIGVAEKLSIAFPERRDRSRVVHSLADMIRARTFAIACGYEDGNDLDHLRRDPAFKLACGRLPDTGRDLCSQPTLSRLENAPRLREVIRLSYALVDLWMDSYEHAPSAVTLDIDDTVDVTHGRQQLSFFNAYYDEHCFLPIHVYDTERSRPVAVILRPGKVPSGIEVRAHLRRLVRRIRRRWPTTRITFRGDSHYASPEAMVFCERNSVDYIFGLAGKAPLARKLDEVSDAVCITRALDNEAVVRGYAETTYRAGSWDRDRRVIARIEATEQGLDIRYVVTNLSIGSAEWVYNSLYCARGQAENLIKLHKSQLASDRTSCRSALANQVRLVLHTAAYWLVLTVRDAIPKPRDLATAEFATIRLRLLKIAARVIETAGRVRLAFAAACTETDLFRGLANALMPRGP